MKDTMETKICLGCGAPLQSSDIDKEGYIPENKLSDGSIYCQRCFKLKNYSKKTVDNTLISDENIIKEVNQSNSYAFFLIDLFNLSSETISTFKKITTDKTLIISKSDLIFKDINLDNVKNNIKSIYNIDDNIIFLSTKSNYNTNAIFNILNKNNKKKCYILGFTNAGKSTLINHLNNSNDIVTSSSLNTTLDFITMNINGYTIIDTPGFSLKDKFYENNDFDIVKRINPKNYVSPITYQTKEMQIFTIEDSLSIKDFNQNSITFYISNLININKIYKDIESDYENIHINENSDIIIKSLGFINVKKECDIKVSKRYFNLIEVRDSIFKK